MCYTIHYVLYTVYYISFPLPLTPSTNVYTSFSAFVCLCLSLTLHVCIQRLLSSVSSHLSGSPLKLSFSSFPFRLSFVALMFRLSCQALLFRLSFLVVLFGPPFRLSSQALLFKFVFQAHICGYPIQEFLSGALVQALLFCLSFLALLSGSPLKLSPFQAFLSGSHLWHMPCTVWHSAHGAQTTLRYDNG